VVGVEGEGKGKGKGKVAGGEEEDGKTVRKLEKNFSKVRRRR